MRGRGPVLLLALVVGGLLAVGMWRLTAQPPSRRRPVPVRNGPSLRGRVVDAAGRGIPGARVFAIPDTARMTRFPDDVAAEGGIGAENFTDDDGRFVVAAPGDAPLFSLVAEAEGYAPRTVPYVRRGSDSTLVLGRGHRIVGRVLTLEGEPIAGARVNTCGLADHVRVEREVLSGEDGTYRIDRLPRWDPNDSFRDLDRVQVTKEGFAPLFLSGWGTAIAGGSDETTLDLILVRGATLLGKVIDEETGAGVENARVYLWSGTSLSTGGTRVSNPWSPRQLAETRSGPDGSFRFEHVPARGFHRAERRGSPLGYVGAWKAGWSLGTDDVPWTSDGATMAAEVRLRVAASVAGRVVDGEGRPVARARVTAEFLQGSHQGNAWESEFLRGLFPESFPTTNEDGRYRLAGIPASARAAARVSVSAWEPGPPGLEYQRRATSERVLVDVRAGMESAIPDLVLPAAAAATAVEVVVVVSDAAGVPVWGADVSGDYFRSPERTDRHGRVRMPVPAHQEGWPIPAAIVRARGYAPAPLAWPTSLSAGQEIRVVLGVARHVTGRVVNADGTPASYAYGGAYDGTIALEELLAPPRGRARPLYGLLTTGPDGAFSLRDLPDGPYHLIAVAASAQYGRAPPRATASGVASDSTEVLLTLPPGTPPLGGRILVNVTDAATGRPLALADVTATRRKGPDEIQARPTVVESGSGVRRLYFPWGEMDPPAERVTPGRFEIREALPGVYDVDVSASDHTATRVEGVTVRDGDVQVPTVALSRGVRVHGTARLPVGVKTRYVTLTFQPLSRESRHAGLSAELTPEHRYEATGFTPGAYRVLVPTFRGRHNYLLRENDAPVVVPEGATDVAVDLVLVAAGVIQVQLFDARLPSPAYVRGPDVTAAQVAFGRGASLVIAAKDGREIARAGSLESGVPAELSSLVVLPGPYVVTYTPPGGPAQSTTVDVGPSMGVDATIGTPPARR